MSSNSNVNRIHPEPISPQNQPNQRHNIRVLGIYNPNLRQVQHERITTTVKSYGQILPVLHLGRTKKEEEHLKNRKWIASMREHVR